MSQPSPQVQQGSTITSNKPRDGNSNHGSGDVPLSSKDLVPRFDAATTALNKENNAPIQQKSRISLSIAAKYANKLEEPIQLEQVSDGIMPKLDDFLYKLAARYGIAPDNADQITNLLNALTADVYINSYSDKKNFTGSIILPSGFTLDKTILVEELNISCGNNYRRFARAFAKTAIEIMMCSQETFRHLIQKRADENNITFAEAIHLFDGAEGAIIGRASEMRLAALKKMKLERADKSTAGNIYLTGTASNLQTDDNEINPDVHTINKS